MVRTVRSPTFFINFCTSAAESEVNEPWYSIVTVTVLYLSCKMLFCPKISKSNRSLCLSDVSKVSVLTRAKIQELDPSGLQLHGPFCVHKLLDMNRSHPITIVLTCASPEKNHHQTTDEKGGSACTLTCVGRSGRARILHVLWRCKEIPTRSSQGVRCDSVHVQPEERWLSSHAVKRFGTWKNSKLKMPPNDKVLGRVSGIKAFMFC